MTKIQNESRTRTFSWSDPHINAKAAPTMSGLDFFKAIQRNELPVPPIMELLNSEASLFEEGRVIFTLIPEEYHYNPIGTVHGGIISTLCDSAMGCAVHTTLPVGVGYTSLEIKVNFVRAVTRDTGKIFCEGKVIHVGGRVATAEAQLTDKDGRLYAHATTTCLIMRSGK